MEANLHVMGKKFWSVILSIKKAQIFLTGVAPYGVGERPNIERDECIDYLKDHECGKTVLQGRRNNGWKADKQKQPKHRESVLSHYGLRKS